MCRRLFVPVPGRGHWAKLASGHPGIPKPPLRKLDKIPTVFRSSRSNLKKEAMWEDKLDPEFAAVEELLSSGLLDPLSVEASAKLQVLFRRTANRFRSLRRKDERGILLPSKPGGLDVVVTAKSFNRALQVMSRVTDVLESRGFSIQITGTSGTAACIDGRQVRFGIGETIHRDITRKPRVPQPKETWVQ